MPSCIRIIGIGSPVSGDDLGMQLVEMLSRHPAFQKDNIEFVVVERPGTTLLQYFEDADTVCLVDALLDESEKGVVRIDVEDLLSHPATISSHHFGVAETLQLAATLGQLPPRLLIYGVTGEGDWYTELVRTISDDLDMAASRIE